MTPRASRWIVRVVAAPGFVAVLEALVLFELHGIWWPRSSLGWAAVLILGPVGLIAAELAGDRMRRAVAGWTERIAHRPPPPPRTGPQRLAVALGVAASLGLLAWVVLAGLANVVASSAHWADRSAPLTWGSAAALDLPAALFTGGLVFAVIFILIRQMRPSALVLYAAGWASLAISVAYWLWILPGWL